MFMIAQASLFLWLPIVMILYTNFPPRKAVVYSYVYGWLFLPNIGFNLPGLPDYTKMTATGLAVFLAMMVFDLGRLLSIRPRWYDLPIIIWCLNPFTTALANGLGAYEGSSAILQQVVEWGLPYLIGRVYFNDLDGLRDLAEGITIGGLIYVPLCLLEIRLSPVLAGWVYGLQNWEGTRYGGYRPKVFLQTGLELGMWMTNASFLCCLLWSSGAIKTIRGAPFGMMTLALVVTTVLCKATGGVMLLFAGLAVMGSVKLTKRSWVIWPVIMIAPLYIYTRTFNIWSGVQVVELANSTVGGERAQSFEYRLDMERLLADRALERPISGWGRFNRFQITNSSGRVLTVPDGFWIITLGTMGLIGLTCLHCMMLMPMILTIRRFPMARWFDPQIVPVAGMAMILTLEMIDFLSNAMLNPIYPLVMGGVMGQAKSRPAGGHREAAEALAVASEMVGQGLVVDAWREFRRAAELASGSEDAEALRIRAEALDGLGHLLLESGRHGEAEAALRDALVLRDRIAADSPDPDHFRDLAIARDGLSRALAESGRTAEAIGERQIALQTWEILAADHPRNAEYRDRRVNTLNDLAWLLVTDPDPGLRDPARAVLLAEGAVRASADHDACWNTLGVARYRAGDWAGAIEALERSAISSPGGLGTAFDHYFLAMAWCRLRREDQAREWLERGAAWASGHRPGHVALRRFREEAEALLRDARDATVADLS